MEFPFHDSASKPRNQFSATLILLGAVAVAFGGGIYYGRTSLPSTLTPPTGVTGGEVGKPSDVDASLIWDVWRRLEEKYVDKTKIDRQELVYGAAEGVVEALGDPYSVFLAPKAAKRFSDDVRGSFEGIGAEIGIRKDILTVIAPLEATPAQRAGLLAGDKILKINDTVSAGLSIEEAVDLIRGPRGSEVVLVVARDGLEETQEFRIKRDVIKIPVLAWEVAGEKGVKKETPASFLEQLFQAKEGGQVVIKLFHFTDTLVSEFRQAARAIERQKPHGIVLDLRNNPGGFLEVAVDIAGWFLESDTLVAVEDFGSGRKREYRTSGPGSFRDVPVVVLINEGSASAAEILAGALQDQRGVKLVGKKSFGKGSVQELEELRGGATLKITVARWVTPSGKILQEDGLTPDVLVERSQDDIKAKRDPQLEKALELLKVDNPL